MDGSYYFGRDALARNNTWILDRWISDFPGASWSRRQGKYIFTPTLDDFGLRAMILNC